MIPSSIIVFYCESVICTHKIKIVIFGKTSELELLLKYNNYIILDIMYCKFYINFLKKLYVLYKYRNSN